MKKIIETKVFEGGKLKKAYIEVSDKDTSAKAKLRKQIEDIRGDLYDITADALKWNSLLTSMLMRMWAVMPAEQKALMSTEDLAVVDTFMSAFAMVPTRMDKQIQAEGIGAIQKILDREKLVGELF